ncbi:HAD family hydrolase [Alkalicoccus daliensis]|nr:HAD family hydrolase [Alkalicoccus daliensis]
MKAILFDLDGTLLPMDTEAFIKNYTKELAPKVAHIVEPDQFIKALWTGTEAMMSNKDAAKTNETVFMNAFLPIAEVEKDEIWPVLDNFYNYDFASFSYLTSPTSSAREIVNTALTKGYKVAIATNPVFPKVAIEHRLEWAGLKDLPLDHVTYYENSYYTKPHTEYYQSIAEELGVNTNDCVMVGNDKQEDMAAGNCGMKTYLVHGHVIDRGTDSFAVNDEGTLEQLTKDISDNTGIFKT